MSKIKRYTDLTGKAIDNTCTKGHLIFGLKFLLYIHRTVITWLMSKKIAKHVIGIEVEDCKLFMYNTLVSFLIVDEIRTRKLYAPFIGCKKILDLGGYLGESAVYFAQYNATVDIYEADKRNYEILLKNCESYNQIKSYYGAVISGNRPLYFSFDNDDRGTIGTVGDELVPTFDFLTILNQGNFDGIKIDIEGGEYEILDSLITSHHQLQASHLFIEFHDVDKPEMSEKIDKYASYFSKQGYTYTIFDNDHTPIESHEIKEKNISFVNYLFKK